MAEWNERAWELRELAVAADSDLSKRQWQLKKRDVYQFIANQLSISSAHVARIANGKCRIQDAHRTFLERLSEKNGISFDGGKFR